ncbi:MAG: SixA phosphatase family protein [Micromonosporaceae bacterium]
MPTLVLLRHAKTANPEGVPDVSRPLTQRGHADAAAAGAWLDQRGYTPDVVICSPAQRTRQTWHGVALSLPAGAQVSYPDEAYLADADDLLELVCSVAAAGTLLLIGHNPAVSALSSRLDPDGADPDGLRTCGLAVHESSQPWARWRSADATLTASHTARA